MKRNIICIVAIAAAMNLYSQGEMDAYRFSGNDIFGTARGMAMGGAFGALGGDITGVSQNPAGIGVYRSSEIIATLDFTSTDIETKIGRSVMNDSKFNFNFGNIAYIGYVPFSNDVKCFNFGFSYNRLKNLDRSYKMSGKGLPTSITDYIAEITNGTRLNDLEGKYAYDDCPWLGVLGYNTYMINPLNEREYESSLNKGEKVDNRLSVVEKGRVDSYDFTLGTNISDIFYIGATLSLTDLYYEMSSLYSEIPENGGNINLTNTLITDGSGYQFTIGAIVRPADVIRLGVSYHSPTWYKMCDSYYATARFEESEKTPQDPPFDYNYKTPGRLVASVAGIICSKTILSVDYEYSDFSKMNLKDIDGFSLSDDPDYDPNVYLSQDFKGASTLKAGFEYRITPQASLRLGYSIMQSPLEKNFKSGNVQVKTVGTIPQYTLEGDAKCFSWGGGYRFTSNLYMDIAFSWKWRDDLLYAFSPVIANNGIEVLSSTPSKFKNNTYRGLVTLGYKF